MPSDVHIHHLRNKIWLVSAIFILLILSFAWYARTETALTQANNTRFASVSLARELRQSSDDLTRMMRTYVVTGNPLYKKHFQEILDIRNGLVALPVDYHNIYWDLVLNDDRRPHPLSNQHIPLLDRMKLAGINQNEFDQLAQAKVNSDALTEIEFAAMRLVEQDANPSDQVRFKAIQMLSDETYHKAKAGIMQPISDFTQMIDERTGRELINLQIQAATIRIVFVVLVALILWALWSIYQTLHNTLGASVQVLHHRIAELGAGDLETPIIVPSGMENSILGMLSRMQGSLALLDAARKNAEEKLEGSTQRLSNIIHATQAGTWEYNVQTGAVLVNARWASMLGYTLAELSPIDHTTLLRLIHPDDLEQAEILKQLHFEKKVPVYETKIRMQHKEGRWVWILTRGSLLSRTADGEPEWMAGSHLDISAMEKASSQLRENESQMRMMLNEMPIGIAQVDGNGRIFFRNKHLLNLLGYTEFDVPNMDSWVFHAYPDELYRNEATQNWKNALTTSADGRQIISGNLYRVTTKYGTELDIQISGLMTSFGFLAAFVDQTQNRQVQLQLEEAKELAEATSLRLTKAAEVAELGIWERTLKDNTFIWDKRMFEIYEIPEQQQNEMLTYDDWRVKVHPDDIERVEEKYRMAVENNGNYSPTFRIICKDKSIKIIQTVAHILRNKSGEPIKVLGVNRDITAQHELENSLRIAKSDAEAANEAKSSFLAAMSHEIRTPMNGMLGMIKLLTHTELTAQQLDYAKKAENATKALLGIINDILDFSKIEAGKFELDYTDFELGELLSDLSIVLSSNLGDKPVEVLFSQDAKIPNVVIGDPLRLRQVLLNLTGNAIKFTGKGEVVLSIVCLDFQDADGQVTIEFSVTDTGIGIAPDKLSHIFEPFNQAEVSTARRFGGSGLGLAISKHLVEMMGGKLKVSSTPGRGSRFCFTLRFDIATPFKATPKADDRRYKLLIVDDNEVSREILKMMSNANDWDSLCLDSGEEAIAHIRRHGINAWDVILVDWRMPGLDGGQTIREIRSMKDGASAAVILMITANGLELFNQQSRDESHLVVDGYLFKPITSSMLSEAVHDATASRSGKSRRHKTQIEVAQLAGLRILVVEDNRLNQQIAKELLELHGAKVEIAANGLDGVKQALASKPSLILMDMQMPDIDGLEATRRILQNPEMQSIPIIAMTANAMESDREACLAAGMVDHLAKPINLDEVIKTILRHAHNRNWLAPELDSDTEPGQVRRSASQPLVDVDLAIGRLGGNRQFYEKIIQAVRVEGQSHLDELKKFVAQGDLSGAARALHTFKGLIATVGANSLAQLAASTEKLIRDNEPETMHGGHLTQRIHDIDQLLQQVMRELSAIEPTHENELPAAQQISGDPSECKAKLQGDLNELAALLKNKNLRSLSLCAEIKRSHSGWLGIKELGLLLDIDESVNQLNFGQALSLCNNLKEMMDLYA